MTYDRMGRRTVPKLDAAPSETDRAPATPNAGRLARGTARAGAPAGRASGARSRRGLRLRLLWSTALVAALVLTVRVEAIWQQRDRIPAALTFGSPAEAEGMSQSSAGTAAPAAPLVQLAANDAKPKGGAAAGDDRVDPFALGKSQIELLQSLAARRKELDEREQDLVQREGLLAAAEHRIEKKIEDLKAIKAEIEDLIKKYDEQEEAQLRDLVKIYETMKPKDAARIFNELDMEVLLDVIERMKASKTAPVLANMDAGRAKEVTARIAERRQMPDIN